MTEVLNFLGALAYFLTRKNVRVISIGDGKNSDVAYRQLGFPWPVGSVVESDGRKYEVQEKSLMQLPD